MRLLDTSDPLAFALRWFFLGVAIGYVLIFAAGLANII